LAPAPLRPVEIDDGLDLGDGIGLDLFTPHGDGPHETLGVLRPGRPRNSEEVGVLREDREPLLAVPPK
jgi:hypothetical protein